MFKLYKVSLCPTANTVNYECYHKNQTSKALIIHENISTLNSKNNNSTTLKEQVKFCFNALFSQKEP